MFRGCLYIIREKAPVGHTLWISSICAVFFFIVPENFLKNFGINLDIKHERYSQSDS